MRKKLNGKKFPPHVIEAVITNFQSRYITTVLRYCPLEGILCYILEPPSPFLKSLVGWF